MIHNKATVKSFALAYNGSEKSTTLKTLCAPRFSKTLFQTIEFEIIGVDIEIFFLVHCVNCISLFVIE